MVDGIHALKVHLAGVAPEPAPRRFELAAVLGRIVEISSGASSGALTVSMMLACEAQKKGETAAWIAASGASFFPPDAAALGIDLDALVVVRVPSPQDVARAADRLARSGGFGLVVLDLCAPPFPNPLSVNSVHSVAETATLRTERQNCNQTRTPILRMASEGRQSTRRESSLSVPAPLMSRLGALAQRHNMGVVFLTGGDAAGSLGSLVSLRAEASRRRAKGGRFSVKIEAVKDKRAGPGWRHEEIFDGPDGLR